MDLVRAVSRTKGGQVMDRRWPRVLASGNDGGGRNSNIRETLSGFEAHPLALSTTGTGELRAQISDTGDEIAYTLSYSALEGNVHSSLYQGGERAQLGEHVH